MPDFGEGTPTFRPGRVSGNPLVCQERDGSGRCRKPKPTRWIGPGDQRQFEMRIADGQVADLLQQLRLVPGGGKGGIALRQESIEISEQLQASDVVVQSSLPILVLRREILLPSDKKNAARHDVGNSGCPFLDKEVE